MARWQLAPDCAAGLSGLKPLGYQKQKRGRVVLPQNHLRKPPNAFSYAACVGVRVFQGSMARHVSMGTRVF